MKAFRELVKYAAPAEEKVLSLRKEVRRNTTAALVSMPGFNASALTSTAGGSNPAMSSVADETITRHKRITAAKMMDTRWSHIRNTLVCLARDQHYAIGDASAGFCKKMHFLRGFERIQMKTLLNF